MPLPLPYVAEIAFRSPPAILLLLGLAGLYIASRAAADAMTHGPASMVVPGRLALGHWATIVAVAWTAVEFGQSDIALGVVLGTSVAALSLAMGLTTYLAPPIGLPGHGRSWTFLLPGAILTFIAGLTGDLGPMLALMLLVMGGVVWSVWLGKVRDSSSAGLSSHAAHPPKSNNTSEAPVPPRRPALLVLPALQWMLAVALALAAARGVVLGTVEARSVSRVLQSSLLCAAVLSPALLLPMLASGTELAHRSRSSEAADSLVSLAMLNLFALLPFVILAWWFRNLDAAPAGTWSRITSGQPIPLPLHVWRIDLVLLAVLSFALIPVAMGRWVIGRLESAFLIVAYAAYLAVSARLARGQ